MTVEVIDRDLAGGGQHWLLPCSVDVLEDVVGIWSPHVGAGAGGPTALSFPNFVCQLALLQGSLWRISPSFSFTDLIFQEISSTRSGILMSRMYKSTEKRSL